MSILIVSSSLKVNSRSHRLAQLARDALEERSQSANFLDLSQCVLQPFDDGAVYESAAYKQCVQAVAAADSLILASPVYNWSACAELKKFIEAVGSTDSSRPSPFFDKLVSFIFAAGLPHSYMVAGPVALSLMLDFRCVINPHQAYLHNAHWDEVGELNSVGMQYLTRMIDAHVNLSGRLEGLSLTRGWSV